MFSCTEVGPRTKLSIESAWGIEVLTNLSCIPLNHLNGAKVLSHTQILTQNGFNDKFLQIRHKHCHLCRDKHMVELLNFSRISQQNTYFSMDVLNHLNGRNKYSSSKNSHSNV